MCCVVSVVCVSVCGVMCMVWGVRMCVWHVCEECVLCGMRYVCGVCMLYVYCDGGSVTQSSSSGISGLFFWPVAQVEQQVPRPTFPPHS